MEDSERQDLLRILAEKLNRSLMLYLDNCARCGMCVEACHAYASTGDTRYTAVARAQNVRRLYEHYHKITGKLAPWLYEGVELDQKWLDKLYETAYTCTGCRRCMVYCPFGIDTQQIQVVAKAMLIAAGMEPKPLSMRAQASVKKAQNLEATKEKFAKEVEKAKADVAKRWPELEADNLIPLDVKGANILYVSMAEKPSIIPAAGILNAARENWTLSCFEAVNFGSFMGSADMATAISQRIITEAETLGVRKVVICECGTGFRLMKHGIGKRSFEVLSVTQLMDQYVKEGRLKFDTSAIEGRVTYHDPCQLARNAGVYEEPRNVVKALAEDYVELTPNRKMNWCCGGGGGLLLAQEPEFRVATSRVKVEQLKASEAAIVATACEMCLGQLKDLVDEFELDMEVKLITELAAEALVVE